jgi:hypothetical protein
MKELYIKLQKNLGLSLILMIGLSVEFTNFQSMFFRFMSLYRTDWGAINHIPAMFLSAFLLLCIVIFGIRKQTNLSWFLAMLTCVISFAVYSRMNLSWRWENMTEVHFVILILSGMLPLLVAYTTHQIAYEEEFNREEPSNRYERAEIERLMREIRKMHAYNLGRANFQSSPLPQTSQTLYKNATTTKINSRQKAANTDNSYKEYQKEFQKEYDESHNEVQSETKNNTANNSTKNAVYEKKKTSTI